MLTKAARWWEWAITAEASSRAAALIRIGLAALIWARFGSEVALYHNPNLSRVALMLVFTPAVSLMLVGLWTRWTTLASAAIVGAMYYYAVAFPQRSGWNYHHVHVLFWTTFLCAWTPAGRSFSVDRWLALRKAESEGREPPPESGPVWAQCLLALQVSIIYFWAAFDKTHAGYWNGSRLEATLMEVYFGSQYPTWWPGFRAMCVALSWGTVAIEYLLTFGLFIERIRWWCVGIGILFHAILYLTLEVATYSATMILLYLAFFPPDRVHAAIDRLLGHTEAGPPNAILSKNRVSASR